MGKQGRGLIPRAGDSAETVTKLAVRRTARYLAEVRKRYPDAWPQLNRMARQKGAPGMPDWPAWCWLPMAASYAVVSGGGPNRLAASDPRTADMGRLAALAAWRLTKGVYWLEEDIQGRHVSRLWEAGVPVDPRLGPDRFVNCMPQHCVYVALPPMDRSVEIGPLSWPLGVFVHLEYDVNSGRPELRLVADTDGTWEGLEPHPVLLDRPTLLASSRELSQKSLGALLERLPALGDGEEDTAELLAEFGRTIPVRVWPAVEAILDPESVISRWDLPGERPERAQPVKGSSGLRWEPASSPTRWRVSLVQPRPGLRAV